MNATQSTAYPSASNPAAAAASENFDELYGYDTAQRLSNLCRGDLNGGKTAITGATLTQSWALDKTGNWMNFTEGVRSTLDQNREHNTDNEITEFDTTTGTDWADPSHDANGNMTTMPRPAELDEGYLATYDAWNRLVKLVDQDSEDTVAEYKYDGLNRRTVKNTYTGGSLSETRFFYYSDSWQVLEEQVSGVADRQYVWGIRYIDDLVLRDRKITTDLDDERLYSLQDANWNIVALYHSVGALVQRFAYDPYGTSLPLNPDFTPYDGTDYEWEYRFTGRRLDLETALYQYRMRYYHSPLGRFISRDPIGYRAGDTNLFGFVSGSPITALDPFGTSHHHWFSQLGGRGQQDVNRICRDPHVDIHLFTTELGELSTGGGHHYAEHKLFGGIGWKGAYRSVLQEHLERSNRAHFALRKRICCCFLERVVGLMNMAMFELKTAGYDFVPTLHKYNDATQNTVARYSQLLVYACGGWRDDSKRWRDNWGHGVGRGVSPPYKVDPWINPNDPLFNSPPRFKDWTWLERHNDYNKNYRYYRFTHPRPRSDGPWDVTPALIAVGILALIGVGALLAPEAAAGAAIEGGRRMVIPIVREGARRLAG